MGPGIATPLTNLDVLADMEALLTEHKPSLTVFDAFTGALEIHGFDPNSGVEVERFYRTVVKPFQANEGAVLLLDHLTKSKDPRGRYSIGSERKLGGADVHLGFELARRSGAARPALRRSPPTRTGPRPEGPALARPKAAELELASDPASGRITWDIRVADNTAATSPGGPPR